MRRQFRTRVDFLHAEIDLMVAAYRQMPMELLLKFLAVN
jgi:hypothetical protein